MIPPRRHPYDGAVQGSLLVLLAVAYIGAACGEGPPRPPAESNTAPTIAQRALVAPSSSRCMATVSTDGDRLTVRRESGALTIYKYGSSAPLGTTTTGCDTVWAVALRAAPIPVPAPVTVARVTLSPTAPTAVAGTNSLQLTARALDAAGTVLSGRAFAWRTPSSTCNVTGSATSALVYAQAAGGCTVYARDVASGVEGATTVTITAATVTPAPAPTPPDTAAPSPTPVPTPSATGTKALTAVRLSGASGAALYVRGVLLRPGELTDATASRPRLYDAATGAEVPSAVAPLAGRNPVDGSVIALLVEATLPSAGGRYVLDLSGGSGTLPRPALVPVPAGLPDAVFLQPSADERASGVFGAQLPDSAWASVGGGLASVGAAYRAKFLASVPALWATYDSDPTTQYLPLSQYDRPEAWFERHAQLDGDTVYLRRALEHGDAFLTRYLLPSGYGSSTPYGTVSDGLLTRYWLTGDERYRTAVVQLAPHFTSTDTSALWSFAPAVMAKSPPTPIVVSGLPEASYNEGRILYEAETFSRWAGRMGGTFSPWTSLAGQYRSAALGLQRMGPAFGSDAGEFGWTQWGGSLAPAGSNTQADGITATNGSAPFMVALLYQGWFEDAEKWGASPDPRVVASLVAYVNFLLTAPSTRALVVMPDGRHALRYATRPSPENTGGTLPGVAPDLNVFSAYVAALCAVYAPTSADRARGAALAYRLLDGAVADGNWGAYNAYQKQSNEEMRLGWRALALLARSGIADNPTAALALPSMRAGRRRAMRVRR